ncbi:MAG: hypothetical protein FJX77_01745 [Armatimonadetes bacterium]|nr:hypothetical protein [Armatimonadota bacterium]
MSPQQIEELLTRELAAPLPPDELAEVVEGVQIIEELAAQLRDPALDVLQEPVLPLSLEDLP